MEQLDVRLRRALPGDVLFFCVLLLFREWEGKLYSGSQLCSGCSEKIPSFSVVSSVLSGHSALLRAFPLHPDGNVRKKALKRS